MFYEAITSHKYWNAHNTRQMKTFTNYEKEMIAGFDINYSCPFNMRIQAYENGIRYDITKYYDEWYYVMVVKIRTPIEYYKCDQIPGLVEFLRTR